MQKYPSKEDKQLINAFYNLRSKNEISNFLRDLLTPAEIDEFSKRFQIAILLWTTNKSYAEIADQVETSTTTVTRVSNWLYKESYQGYACILKRIYGKSNR